MRIMPAALGLLLATASLALAGEDAVALKDAPGRDVVLRTCIGCHSLDYVQMNAPFLDAKGWEAEVRKMMKAYGAPVPEEDVAEIVKYLAGNYGKN
jgi:mono/diheme cytochrome c family protein